MTREIVSDSKQDWATPQWLFDVLNEEMKFEVDLMAAWYNAKLPTFYGPGSKLGEDVFAQDWGNIRGFANPPYKALEHCLEFAVRQANEGAETTWLVPANTDTKWFHEYAVKGQIQFFKGRIFFEDHTPPEVEAVWLLEVIERKVAKGSVSGILKDAKKLGAVLREFDKDFLYSLSKNDRLRDAMHLADVHCPDWLTSPMTDRKKPGPGFPSMLVRFLPGMVGAKTNFLTRCAKTGKLL